MEATFDGKNQLILTLTFSIDEVLQKKNESSNLQWATWDEQLAVGNFKSVKYR